MKNRLFPCALSFLAGIALGGFILASYLSVKALKLSDPTQYWTMVGSLGTCVGSLIAVSGLFVAAFSFRAQVRQNSTALGVDVLLKLSEHFDSQRMRKARAAAAENLRQDPNKSHPAIDAVIDYFEQLGLLVRREVVDAEFAWHEFYESFFHYYHLTVRYRAVVAATDSAIWADVEYLYVQVTNIQERANRGSALVPTPAELRTFVDSEARCNE
ncbi:hypothetical protein KEC55_12540 [Burkholderia cepacia]|uniref:DUF4760 domain-containing protein n=1 Tax=Burkholderia stabilis TaxID=95485 RepID=A0A1Y1BLD5_9BURK|nr:MULTISPECIES: hypothetical protein [Burkholderia cepacia complex]WGY67669.1 hypothetical protein KEC55_12540 [Burkholderia cepacia]BAX58367.1 hypothetical protein BSFP_011810 [Burkholderia stabilis]